MNNYEIIDAAELESIEGGRFSFSAGATITITGHGVSAGMFANMYWGPDFCPQIGA